MANGGKKRKRLERVAALELPPGKVLSALRQLRRREVALRVGAWLMAAIAICAVSQAWAPPFGYRTGEVPSRDVLASVPFTEPDPAATEEARQKARGEARYVYAQDAAPLVQLRAALRNTVVVVTKAVTFADLDKNAWKQFAPPLADGQSPMSVEQEEEQFEKFRESLASDMQLTDFEQQVAQAMAPLESHGLLEKLPPEHEMGNQRVILVHPIGKPDSLQAVPIDEVLIGAVSTDNGLLRQHLNQHIASPEVASRVFDWLRPRLVGTLKLDTEGSQQERQRAADAVDEVETTYPAGHPIAKAGVPLGPKQIRLLHLEYNFRRQAHTVSEAIGRGLAMLLLILAISVPCGLYLVRWHGELVDSFRNYAGLLLLLVATAALARWMSDDTWRATVIPLLLFGMTIAIAYGRPLALLLSTGLSIVLTLALGTGLGSLILWMGVVMAGTMQLANIRTRSRLILIGLTTAVVAFVLTIVVALLDYVPTDWAMLWQLLTEAGRNFLWTLLVGFIITGLLPLIEHVFGVLTDISLLELGDMSHPLLQELVRRAPGTYNHSINVASMAEAAAESIGARGLLVRVGAYFHDIGKMLKPGYFVENQGEEANRHETLVPAMSTLIIIAHVKDGADLARQHQLPQPIIDFIEQHHGTTLVEYFYQRANEQREANPDAGAVSETSFRYPGPKPQTREAGVMMLADAVESASRVLVEPTPARIENLVEELAMKRLLDGQFDDCELTLQEIHTVCGSLVKSLIAVYHGRVKYPGQRTA